MLNTSRSRRGVSLIELMVVLTIFALALALGAPSFGAWIQNLRLRAAAESIASGLQFAKSEAVARNAVVRFQFTSTMDNSCVLSATSALWVVNSDPATPGSVESNCAIAASLTPAASPFILGKSSGTPGPSGLTVSSNGVTSISFNGLGRTVGAASMRVDLTNPSLGSCAAANNGGPVTCLRVVVSTTGEIRMCNPQFALPDPQGC